MSLIERSISERINLLTEINFHSLSLPSRFRKARKRVWVDVRSNCINRSPHHFNPLCKRHAAICLSSWRSAGIIRVKANLLKTQLIQSESCMFRFFVFRSTIGLKYYLTPLMRELYEICMDTFVMKSVFFKLIDPCFNFFLSERPTRCCIYFLC